MKRKQPIGKLTPFDWNFSKVQDRELVACCYFEYARESRSLLQCLAGSNEAGADEQKSSRSLLDAIREQAFPIFVAFTMDESGFIEPWRLKSEQKRAAICDEINTSLAVAPEAIVKPIVRAHCFAKLNLTSELCEEVNSDAGVERILLEIDWGNFTNEEIGNYMKRWAKTARPKQIPQPDGRGKKALSWRVKLEQLAIMRLLHHYGLGQLKKKQPDAWTLLHRDWYDNESNKGWYDQRKLALEAFRKLFPFLNAGEMPLSWNTVADQKSAK